jgi:hypothetical protein
MNRGGCLKLEKWDGAMIKGIHTLVFYKKFIKIDTPVSYKNSIKIL